MLFSSNRNSNSMAKKKKPQPKPRRTHKIYISLSDQEYDAINAYCKKRRVPSRAELFRQATVRFVMGKLLEDYPTLFEKKDLDELIVPEK